MLSASPAIPLSSIEFAPDSNGRRLSLVTAHGREFFTHRDGLPSPGALTPIEHTPAGSGAATPVGSDGPGSRRPSDPAMDEEYKEDAAGLFKDGQSLFKAPSRGGIWHDNKDVSTTALGPRPAHGP